MSNVLIIDKKFKDEPNPSAMLLIEEIQNLKEECILLDSQIRQKSKRYKDLSKKLYINHKIRFKKDGKSLQVENTHVKK
jgi:hypothetical protein